MTTVDENAVAIDGGIPNQLALVPDAAALLEQQGYQGCWTGETNHDPFLPMVLAAEHTSRIRVGTNIAVAFARNPMSVAQLGWDLQAYSQGRFVLGLGTQIRPHIEKRFGMPWSNPARRMGEFVAALQAIWSAWRDGSKLQFEGDFYTHKIMTPMFTPEPSPHPFPPVLLAAVGEAMTEMCGEVADGLLVHAFTTRRYLDEVTMPTLARGLARSDRQRPDVEVTCPIFVVTGRDEQEMATAKSAVRQQIAFYGSTPAYRKVLDLHGVGEMQTELRELSLRGEWEAMGRLVDDDILAAFAVVAPVGEVAEALRTRCAGVIDRAMPIFGKAAPETVARVLADLVGD
ncbi:TIGR03617 family F420-dependent LLM class oxidoreductase [Aldersonia sp. NBC_00410]|uniref:TIGR03617 family F420-dependent LLM class oxidoreductase n=1 Tax=Aldersonia sp. NBC_00410 TaxID=2975954 RepID=UPI00225B8702|nr:TIGR03617 family F420-dependent LLM class oxidoreductase [Aldersonia sp. NBC_00410]MCX5045347.1 TIGR03617 family F420-dependent LLM class oxidoreductase [Aldersonia sp. NBC_00410]